MNNEAARKVMEACRAKAAEIGKPVSVAIVDAAGLMVLFERIGDPPPFTAMIAEGKAAGSAFSGRPSAFLANISQNVPALGNAIAARLGPRFVPLQGAVPLSTGGAIAGAVGVSGATSEEDEQIAKAGAEAFSG
jgi:glc operon protein GlcG